MQNEISELKSRLEMQETAANRNEHFSRRNNVRLIGIPEPQEGQREDCIQIAEDILLENLASPGRGSGLTGMEEGHI